LWEKVRMRGVGKSALTSVLSQRERRQKRWEVALIVENFHAVLR
jgi:predicted acetyltransferase